MFCTQGNISESGLLCLNFRHWCTQRLYPHSPTMKFLLAATLSLLAVCDGTPYVAPNEMEFYEPVLTPPSDNLRGLQKGIQYNYKYTGTVSTWISENPAQYSGSAIRADLDLEMTQDNNIRIKASNVEEAVVNDKTDCHVLKHTNFTYHPMNQADATLLQRPFLIQVDEASNMYLKVTEEPLWVTNIRRGIINTLPLPILTGYNRSRLTYRLREETLIGQCYNWYSQLKLASFHAALENKMQEEKIEEDVQRYSVAERFTGAKSRDSKQRPKTKRPSKTRKAGRKTGTKTGTKTGSPSDRTPPARLIQPINDTLWVLTRTLDDEGCKENHFTIKINGNHESLERTQRSSDGTFLIRGEQGGVMRLERAEVKGDIVVYTAECHNKFIRTTSKQTLELKAVRHSRVQVEVAEEMERKQLSFKTQEGPRLLTVDERLTGIHPSEPQIQASIGAILEYLALLAVSETEQNENAPAFMDVFHRIVERIALLTKDEIEEVVTLVPDTPRDKKTLYQALLTSGSKEALTYLLDQMNDVTFRNANLVLVFQLFQAATITITDPSLIHEMLLVVSKMEEHEEPVKTTALLSIAKIVRHYCLDPQLANGCDPKCENDAIVDAMLINLSNGLRDTYKWKQLVHMQAMCTLGTPHIIPFLESIIQGKNNDDIDLRISAIYCLSENLQPKTAHSMVMDLLVPLFNNPTEVPEVRSIAFLVISTWEPTNLSWWEQIALSTWRENSPQVVAFISTALTSFSEGTDPRSVSAKKVIHLAKHLNKKEAFSLTKSVNVYLEEAMANCNGGTQLRLSWLTSTQSVFPATAFYYLYMSSVMGETFRNTGVFFSNFYQFFYKDVFANALPYKDWEDSETFFAIFEELQEQLELTATSFIERDPHHILSIFEPLHTILSDIADGSPNIICKWISEDHLLDAIPVHFRQVDTTLAFPSDLGLPVTVKHEEDVAITLNFQFFGTSFELHVKVEHQNSLDVKTLLPWVEGRAAGASLEAHTKISLPLRVDITTKDSVKLLLPPTEANLVMMSGSMYTSITPLFPFTSSVLETDQSTKVQVWRGDVLESSTNLKLLDKLGMHVRWEWSGDFQKPHYQKTFEELNPIQLHYTNFVYRLLFDPTRSQSSVITFTAHTYLKKIEASTQDTDEQFTQVSQGAADYDYMSQVSGSSDSEIFGQSSSSDFNFQEQQAQSQTVTTHTQRVDEQISSFQGAEIYTLSVMVEPDSGPRKYEFACTLATTQQKEIGVKTPMNFYVTFVNSSVTEIFADNHWTCFDLGIKTPYVPPLMPLEVFVATNMSSSLSLSMYDADYCGGSPALLIEAYQDMSSTALAHVLAENRKKKCDGSFPKRLVKLFDIMNLEIRGDQELVNTAVALQSTVTNFLDLTLVDIIGNGLQDSDNRIRVQGTLNLKTDVWMFDVAVPHKTLTYSRPNQHYAEVFATSISQHRVFDLLNYDLDKACYLSQHMVRTFDGLVHDFEPSSCWTTATINIPTIVSRGKKYLQLAIQARYIDDQWEVRLIWPHSALILDITRSEILVNEEVFSGHSDKFVLHPLPDNQLVEAGMALIWVGDTVEIRISDIYYGEVAGLCGNYDGEPNNDMRGPLGCLYTDPALLTTAWSSPAYGCSRLSLRSKRAKLAEFRDTCDKEVFQPTGISQTNVMENCTSWEYQEHTSPAGYTCYSRVPVPVCLPGCEADLTFTSNLRYDCYLPSFPSSGPSSPSSGQAQQQHQDSISQCISKVLPATIPAGCFH